MSLPSFPLKKILILLILLAVPGAVYYLLKEKGVNRYRPLAIYGEKQVLVLGEFGGLGLGGCGRR